LKMALIDVLRKLKGSTEQKEPETFTDDETRDKYLRSLRRERRMQMEELEKKLLKKKIAEFKKQKMKRELFGIAAEHNLLRNDKAVINAKKKINQAKWF